MNLVHADAEVGPQFTEFSDSRTSHASVGQLIAAANAVAG